MNHSPTATDLILDEDARLTLSELCQACAVHAEVIVEMVDEGVLTPTDRDATSWQFSGPSLRRARIALRLQQDLAINLSGAALALDLLDDIDALRARLSLLESLIKQTRG